LSNEHTDFFIEHGYLRLPGFHPGSRMMAIRRKVIDEVKRLPGGGIPRAVRDLPVFQQIGKLSARVNVPGLHETLVTAPLIDLVTRLGRHAPFIVQPTQLLLSPPSQGAWTLSGLNWHVDVASAQDRIPGIQAFFLVDEVAPRGGATLALAGSHRVGGPGSPSAGQLRGLLREATELGPLRNGQGTSIIEMSGRAGDVFLMDMRLLHTPSINATKSMRMMATSRCLMEVGHGDAAWKVPL